MDASFKYSSGKVPNENKQIINKRLAKLNQELIKETISTEATTQGQENGRLMNKVKAVVEQIDDDDDELRKIRESRLYELREKSKSYRTQAPGSIETLRETGVADFLKRIVDANKIGLLHFFLPLYFPNSSFIYLNQSF